MNCNMGHSLFFVLKVFSSDSETWFLKSYFVAIIFIEYSSTIFCLIIYLLFLLASMYSVLDVGSLQQNTFLTTFTL